MCLASRLVLPTNQYLGSLKVSIASNPPWWDLEWRGQRAPWYRSCRTMDRMRPYGPDTCPWRHLHRQKPPRGPASRPDDRTNLSLGILTVSIYSTQEWWDSASESLS